MQFGRVRNQIQSTLWGTTQANGGATESGQPTVHGPKPTDGRGQENGPDYGGGREPEAATNSTAEQPDTSGNLFQCSTCSAVYIDDEKETCPSCNTEVEQVRSTFSR
ncbi:hypothetical protein C481_09722 [Natrialba asiatica DSM 12278]|uniref:Uncharacterized protein n=1 Tax=Natrialba asiatica (strain ATCC 700177 / DSM 12278 / JCM 9576 / FERM P-10747 / NBRC 102637 / 172P1) TaxID=29540 RepID=M0AWK1_NATA1|nr:hypothetical protein C481_09722 [Natrialba asiatica DSM 12278]